MFFARDTLRHACDGLSARSYKDASTRTSVQGPSPNVLLIAAEEKKEPRAADCLVIVRQKKQFRPSASGLVEGRTRDGRAESEKERNCLMGLLP